MTMSSSCIQFSIISCCFHVVSIGALAKMGMTLLLAGLPSLLFEAETFKKLFSRSLRSDNGLGCSKPTIRCIRMAAVRVRRKMMCSALWFSADEPGGTDIA